MSGGREARQWMLMAFKLHGCERCGKRPPEIELRELHCHHRDPSTKRLNGSRGMLPSYGLGNASSRASLLDELLKCEVLCADCHAKEHSRHDSEYVQGVLFSGTGEAWRATI